MDNIMGKFIAFIGTYTNTGSRGIYSCVFENGRLSAARLAAEIDNPTYLTIADDRLFCVIETDCYRGREGGGAAAFRLDRATGTLTGINTAATIGKGPCHLHFDRENNLLLTANYSGGSLSAFRILPDGRISGPAVVLPHRGRGPDTDRQEAPHVHFVDSVPGSKTFCSVDLALDEIDFYEPAAESSRLIKETGSRVKLKPGCGPRHLAFSQDGEFIYVLTELSSEIAVLKRCGADSFCVTQYIPAVPGNTPLVGAAAVKLTSDGSYLYASSRGDNTVSVFRINNETGLPAFVSSAPCGGRMPRDIALDPSEQWLIAANQLSDSLCVFAVDPFSGRLSQTQEFTQIKAPVCIQFAGLT